MADDINIVIADDHPVFRHGLQQVDRGQTDMEVVARSATGPPRWSAFAARRPTSRCSTSGCPASADSTWQHGGEECSQPV